MSRENVSEIDESVVIHTLLAGILSLAASLVVASEDGDRKSAAESERKRRKKAVEKKNLNNNVDNEAKAKEMISQALQVHAKAFGSESYDFFKLRLSDEVDQVKSWMQEGFSSLKLTTNADEVTEKFWAMAYETANQFES